MAAVLFMLFYRLPEALLIRISNLFLIKPVSEGGLGLSTQEVGFVQGTVGVLGLTLGGIIGGIAASRNGLKKWLWPMVWSITLPDLVYVYLELLQSTNFLLINAWYSLSNSVTALASLPTCCSSYIIRKGNNRLRIMPSARLSWPCP